MSSEATGEADDSRQQPSQVTLSNALLCLDTVCAYMEMADCDSYKRLYGLIIDQVQEIATAENNDSLLSSQLELCRLTLYEIEHYTLFPETL